MLGPMHVRWSPPAPGATAAAKPVSGWEPTVMGLAKRVLLQVGDSACLFSPPRPRAHTGCPRGRLPLRQHGSSSFDASRSLFRARPSAQDVVLPHVAKSGGMQRLLAEYAALVEELQQREEEEGGAGAGGGRGGAENMDAT